MHPDSSSHDRGSERKEHRQQHGSTPSYRQVGIGGRRSGPVSQAVHAPNDVHGFTRCNREPTYNVPPLATYRQSDKIHRARSLLSCVPGGVSLARFSGWRSRT